eukprot:SAG22_NODE_2189_length_2863_cov_3.101664_6_plen_133_part_00
MLHAAAAVGTLLPFSPPPPRTSVAIEIPADCSQLHCIAFDARLGCQQDNIFATYMTSLSSKDIAYSNFIQVNDDDGTQAVLMTLLHLRCLCRKFALASLALPLPLPPLAAAFLRLPADTPISNTCFVGSLPR